MAWNLCEHWLRAKDLDNPADEQRENKKKKNALFYLVQGKRSKLSPIIILSTAVVFNMGSLNNQSTGNPMNLSRLPSSLIAW